MLMPLSLVEAEVRIRKYVASQAATGMLYGFDFEEGFDFSLQDVGSLLEQENDFWLFECHVMRTGRAGPGQNSPRRAWCEMDITLFTKQARDKIRFTSQVEAVSNWFADKTIDGIRFRSFEPTPATPLHGFTAYGGVINYQFEIATSTE